MGVGEKNQNFDLKQQALKEFELKDVKELLNKAKSSAFKIDKNAFQKLDKNDDKISNTEEALYEQAQEALDIIKFLEGLVLELEKKQNNALPSFGVIDNKIWSTENEIGKEKMKKNNNQEKLDEILKKHPDMDSLLQNKEDRRKLIEIGGFSCITIEPTIKGVIKGKNENQKGQIQYSDIQEMILNKEKENIINILESKGINHYNPEKIFEIKNNGCNPEISQEYLKTLKGKNGIKLNNEDIKNIIEYKLLNKTNKTTTELTDIFAKYGDLNMNNFDNKTPEEIDKLFKEKNVSQEDQEKIIESLGKLKRFKDIRQTLSFGLEGYNYFSNEYYIQNSQDIIKISDEKKFIEVISYLKSKNQKIESFYNLATPSFRDKIEIVKKFYKVTNEKLNYDSVKEIDFINLNQKKQIELLEMLSYNALDNFIIKYDTIIEKIGIKKYSNRIKELNKKIYQDYTLDNIDEIYEIENKIERDNTLLNILQNNSITDIANNLKELDSLLLETIQGLSLSNYPKTLNYILSEGNEEILEIFIKYNPSFFNHTLNKNEKENYNLLYVKNILKSKKSTIDKGHDLALINFKDIDQMIDIYNLIEKEPNGKDIIHNLLSRPIFKIQMKNFQKNNFKKKNNLDENKKKELENIMGNVLKYGESYKNDFKKTYEEKINEPTKEIQEKKDEPYKTKFKNLFWSKNTEKLFNMFEKGIKDSETTEVADISTIFHQLMEKTINGQSVDTRLEKLTKLVTYPAYKKILKELNIRIQETKIEIDKQNTKNINELTKNNLTDKTFLKTKKLLENGNFTEKQREKLEKIFEQRFKEKVKKLKTEGKKIDKNKIYNEILNEFIGDSKISNNLKVELRNIVKGIKINNSNEAIKNTYNTVKAYNAFKNGDKKAIAELKEEYEENYLDSVENNIIEYNKEKLAETSIEKKEQYDRLKNTSYPLDTETGIVTISENGITKNISLTPAERLLVDKNPETLENIVDFYKTLDRIGLSKLWTIKEDLFSSIQNAKGIGFNIDSNYLNENEIKIFLNSILQSVGEDEISPVFTLNNFMSIIEQKNKTQIGGNEAIVNTTYKETYIENKLFSKFVPRESTVIGFNKTKFEESIS